MYIDSLLTNFKVDLLNVYQSPILFTVLTIFLLFNTITDYKYEKIYNKSNLALFISRIVLGIGLPYTLKLNMDNVYGMILGLMIILVPAVIFIFTAGGDIKLMAVVGFYLGLNIMIVFSFVSIFIYLISGIIIGIINKKLEKKKEIPFAPFIFIAHIILLIISFLI